jgi:hypothetical protein
VLGVTLAMADRNLGGARCKLCPKRGAADAKITGIVLIRGDPGDGPEGNYQVVLVCSIYSFTKVSSLNTL